MPCPSQTSGFNVPNYVSFNTRREGQAQCNTELQQFTDLPGFGTHFNRNIYFNLFWVALSREGTLFFQQDNHPIHTTNRIQRWFTRRRDVDPVNWPPNSSDMNPIQNLWAAVKRILRSNWAEQPPVRIPEELWDRVLDAWEEMAKNLDLFHNLVDSMPRRMRAVVDAGEMKIIYGQDKKTENKIRAFQLIQGCINRAWNAKGKTGQEGNARPVCQKTLKKHLQSQSRRCKAGIGGGKKQSVSSACNLLTQGLNSG
ncbi:hypothetical protein ANN_11960 [Periplaneta americana]|uniref:Tc1-like transposase DDE domain-containing protein n=1 Tax=Periplaneta americana TaxID=6978 RepID=A0ABQ8T6I0_PERAM|nr:hypothetical protein ANN_11960 [Periplaneta americana]